MRTAGRIPIALVLCLLLPSPALAEAPVHQALLPPTPLDPLDFPDLGAPADLEARFYTLPDGDRVEWYRLSGWARLSSRVALGGGVSYVGLEGSRTLEYGGGPAWLVLTTKLGPRGSWGLGIDIDSTLPIGDENLYPVSSDAASIGLRVRVSAGRWFGGRSWVGWYTRRISPPTGSERPASDWPSGSGWMLAWHAHQERWSAAAQARYDFAGLPESFWFEADATWFVGRDLGLRAGGTVTAGSADSRPADWGWLVGVRWRPSSPEEGGK